MLNSIAKLLANISKRGNVITAVIVLTAVVIMIIPIPTTLADILITLNISVSVLILLVAFSLVSPTEFTTLPSLILIATLFRLAITITTSRLILLQADAGDIVAAFGHFVVGGNMAVGLIIFLIITTAQFLVITKGSERVAEVAARFTLDALPGKQMSIDSDLRNGDITQAEARRLRKTLERESQLYGAMDGAMKFVKGDAMASLVVIIVNIAGGLAIGTVQRGLSFADASAKYLLLSVGDGLVAQLPALLVSVAAGTVITRVASEDQRDLGSELSRQLFSQSRALGLTAIGLAGFAAIPGFPSYAFLTLAAALGLAAYLGRRSKPAPTAMPELVKKSPEPSAATATAVAQPAGGMATSAPLELKRYRVLLRLGAGLHGSIEPTALAAAVEKSRNDLLSDVGVLAPEAGHTLDSRLGGNRFCIDFDGVPVFEGEFDAQNLLVDKEADDLDLLEIPYQKAQNIPGFRNPVLVEALHEQMLAQSGISYYRAADLLGTYLLRTLRRHATEFVGIQETRQLLIPIERDYPDLFKEVQQHLTLQNTNEILRRLVSEGVSIGNLRLILEALVRWGYREKDTVVLTEYVRSALSRLFCRKAF